jgi:hypothetical protein
MFVRRKANKSGTVSVQAVSKHRGQYKGERSFGIGQRTAPNHTVHSQMRQLVPVVQHACNQRSYRMVAFQYPEQHDDQVLARVELFYRQKIYTSNLQE